MSRPQVVDAEQRQALLGPPPGRWCRRPAPRRSRAPGAAGGWRCGACPASAAAISPAAPGVERDAEDAGGPGDDGLEVGRLVEVEPGHEAEAVAQRAGDEAGAGGGADQREAGHVEADRAGRGALAQHDVELEVLHRRVEHLLDRPREPVDLVDEEHVAFVELAEDGREVARPVEGRARRDVQAHVHLRGDDAGQGGLAEPRRAGEEQVVGGLAPRRAASRMIERCSLSSAWPDEVVEGAAAAAPASSATSASTVGRPGLGVEQLVTHQRTSVIGRRPGAAAPA